MVHMTVEQLFGHAISWEIQARDLYLAFAEAFPHHPAVQKLWRLMASDESTHAALLRQAMESTSAVRLSEQLDDEGLQFVVAVEQALTLARATNLRTLEDAYGLAHKLESSEVNTVFQLLVINQLDDQSRKALLSSQFDEHIYRLERLDREFPLEVRRRVLYAR